MVKHIVMWTLHDFADGQTKQENAKRAKEMLEALKTKIPGIRHLEVGINFTKSDAAYDLALYSEMESREALAVYQDHLEHKKVIEFMQKIRLDRRVVDYEI